MMWLIQHLALGASLTFALLDAHLTVSSNSSGSVIEIAYTQNTAKCLDLPGGNTKNGNLLWLWDCTGLDNQKWIFVAYGGRHKIVYAMEPSKCIDVPGGNFSNGNQLQLWDCLDVVGQSWGYDAKAKTVYLASSSSDASKCMDLRGGSIADGNAIEVWDCNGTPNQQWAFRVPPPPTPGVPPSDGCFRGKGEWGVPLTSQKSAADSFWQYQWGPAPYGTDADIRGVLQIVNGGSKTMWIRYAGKGISPGEQHDWQKYITQPSALNGNKAHQWNGLNQHGMTGQGNGFKLEPGEYQIVPFTGSACWAGASLGCDSYGARCAVSPNGRGAGIDASAGGQPNTLFEWTAPGVWDASLVDGFGIPMKVEVDGCGFPGTGSQANCRGSDAVTHLELEPSKCPNKIFTSGGRYVGCKSMCGCQNAAEKYRWDTDPACPSMASVSSITNQPHSPGGYCGCPQGDCPQWLRGLYNRDAAGKVYCDAITAMTTDSKGKRAVYCQAYDDNAGTRSYGNGIMKATFCNKGFEDAEAPADKFYEPHVMV